MVLTSQYCSHKQKVSSPIEDERLLGLLKFDIESTTNRLFMLKSDAVGNDTLSQNQNKVNINFTKIYQNPLTNTIILQDLRKNIKNTR